MSHNQSVYLLSLGCPKNEVDAECMLFQIEQAGYKFTQNPQDADFIIVNTCGFIDAAKAEAIGATLDLGEVKRPGAKLILTGCLPQRFMAEIYADLPEVDACLGTAEYDRIVEVMEALYTESFEPKTRPLPPGSLSHLAGGRIYSKDRNYAYLKVSEGCSNNCAFCAIPGIRGPLRSRPPAELIEEAKIIEQQGFKELILVAQDTARYGLDLKSGLSLSRLLKDLLEASSIPWIRTMYTYGDAISQDLIQLLADEDRLVPYLDMPIQHASDKVLRAMRRKESKADISRTYKKLRSSIPNLSLRSTILVGFPGETEADIEELLEFIEEHPFDRLGCFQFSAEEKTLAYRMPNQVPEEIAADRLNRVMKLQNKIAHERAEARLGTQVEVLVEGVSDDGLFYIARSGAEAPEVDPLIYLLNQKEENLKIGDFVKAEIIDVNGYDLTAKTLDSDLTDGIL